MATNREIVTLQLGDYANHVAAHYWNLEWENANLNTSNIDIKDNEEDNTYTNTSEINTTNPYKSSKYNQSKPRSKQIRSSDHTGKPSKRDTSHKNINPNICFHSTTTQNKTIYTPRTIIFATQGSEGNINSNIYDTASDNHTNVSTWTNKVNVVQQSQHKSDSKFWSDYLSPSLHDKSLFLLDGIHHFSSPFFSYSTGYDLLNSGTTSSNDLSESIDDRIRWYVESCDWFQGFQIFETSYNSFSGFLPTIVNRIHDDYSNKCVLLYNLLPSQATMEMEANINKLDNKQTMKMMRRRFKLNSILSMTQIWDEISNIIPISVDFWDSNKRQNINNKKFYNTSIIGSCLHHFTNGVRLNNSNIRLIDIINCYVKKTSMKLSMLSSCSTHLDLNMNYQAIDSIEKLLMFNSDFNDGSNKKQQIKKYPIFPRLSCLGPVGDKYLANDYVLNSRIFGEYSCLSGTNLYDTSDRIIKEWKQNKMVLAQKQGSSKSDIDLWCDKWQYDSEKENYHLKLMTKLASKAGTPLKWHLVNKPWKLPSGHPFYFDDKKDNELKQEDEYDEEEEKANKNRYSIWSSGWSSSIIGESYLKESAGDVNDVIKYRIGEKIFGDVELELNQYQEELTALADTYSGEKDIDSQ